MIKAGNAKNARAVAARPNNNCKTKNPATAIPTYINILPTFSCNSGLVDNSLINFIRVPKPATKARNPTFNANLPAFNIKGNNFSNPSIT